MTDSNLRDYGTSHGRAVLSLRTKQLPGVKNIIAVASGKGGVGKTTRVRKPGANSSKYRGKSGITGCRCLWA